MVVIDEYLFPVTPSSNPEQDEGDSEENNDEEDKDDENEFDGEDYLESQYPTQIQLIILLYFAITNVSM